MAVSAHTKMILVVACLLAVVCSSQAQFQGQAGPQGFNAQAPGGFGLQGQPNFPQPQQPQGSFQSGSQFPGGAGSSGFNFGKK